MTYTATLNMREGERERERDRNRDRERQVERQRWREHQCLVGALQFTPHFHVPERVHTTLCCSCYIFAM